MIHKLEVKPTDSHGYRVCLDGNKVRCNALDIRLRVDEIPSCKMNVFAEPEIEIDRCMVLGYTSVDQIAATRKRRKKW